MEDAPRKRGRLTGLTRLTGRLARVSSDLRTQVRDYHPVPRAGKTSAHSYIRRKAMSHAPRSNVSRRSFIQTTAAGVAAAAAITRSTFAQAQDDAVAAAQAQGGRKIRFAVMGL